MTALTHQPGLLATEKNSDAGLIGIYRKPSILLAADDLALFSRREHSYELLGLRKVDDHLHVTDLNLKESAITVAPSMLCALFAGREDQLSLLRQAHDWLKARLPVAPPVPQLVDEPLSDAVIERLVAKAVIGLVQRQAILYTGATREVAILRQAQERLQNAFAAVETVLYEAGLQKQELAFTAEPARGADGNDCVVEIPETGLRQILPVTSRGLAAIALHTQIPENSSSNEMRVVLESLEDSRILATWHLKGALFTGGWNVMVMPRGIDGLPRTVALRIFGVPGTSDMLQMSMSERMPVVRYQIADATSFEPVIDRTLAMRLWVGMPDVRPLREHSYWEAEPDEGPGLDISYNISPEQLEAVSLLSPPPDPPRKFNVVAYISKTRSIFCHPLTEQMTVAGLHNALPRNTERVSAHVHVDNAAAHPVEFALAVASTLEEAQAIVAAGGEDAKDAGFSGWLRVRGGESGQINLFIRGSAGSNLVLATRMADHAADSYAGCRFSGLRYWTSPSTARDGRAECAPAGQELHVRGP